MKRIALLMVFVLLITLTSGCKKEEETKAPVTNTPTMVSETVITPTPEVITDDGSGNEPGYFIDSLERKVKVPENITKVAVSGPLAQMLVFAIAPDRLVGIASKWNDTAIEFIDSKYRELPVLGQLYGGKGELNLETLLASGAEVVIDVGEAKGSITEDMDDLQAQTGIPFIHINAGVDTMAEASRSIGSLLKMKDEATTVEGLCNDIYTRMKDISEQITKKKVLYCLGDKGLNVIAKGSYHAGVIDLLSDNVAVVEAPSSKGTGNEVDMEQILNWNPDVILFAPGSIYSSVGSDSTWQKVTAIADKRYYEVPNGPYNWMGFPPSIQCYMGMLWMIKLLYVEKAAFDLYTEISDCFNVFYHCYLTQEQFNALIANSLPDLSND